MDNELTRTNPTDAADQLLRQLHDAPLDQKRRARIIIASRRRALEQEIIRTETLLTSRKQTPENLNWIYLYMDAIKQEISCLTPPFPPPPRGHGTGTSPTSTTSTP